MEGRGGGGGGAYRGRGGSAWAGWVLCSAVGNPAWIWRRGDKEEGGGGGGGVAAAAAAAAARANCQNCGVG